MKDPALSKSHKGKRVLWATEFVAKTHVDWKKSVFSDLEKISLNGPNCSQCYWQD